MFVETPYLPSLRKPVVVVMPGLDLSDDVVRMVAIALPLLVLFSLGARYQNYDQGQKNQHW